MKEPQHVVDNKETKEENPNPNTPPEPEDDTQTPKSPRKSRYNLRRNSTSNWKPDFAYYDAIEADSANLINSNNGADDSPEIQGFDGPRR